jgi:hypothetical protein
MIPIVLRLTNTTDHRVTLALQGRPIAVDVVVAREDGATAWRRLEGEVVTAILAVRTLEPAASLEFATTWSGRDRSGAAVPPGRYRATGTIPTDRPEGLRSTPAPLTILAAQ